MGTVYVADGPAGRCAVKVLSAGLAADPALRERFKREAQALRSVQHAHVVRILDEGSDRGFCWYAMEYVEGADLRARLAKGPLTVFEVERLARELLGALGAVHAAQLVHRDLKPGNILLAESGARLCDFGIARVDGASTLTGSAALLGSLRYMAPEQRSGHTSPRADLYSLGVVLHEALGGGLVGDGERPSTPRRLARLIDALLQTQPARRPADAEAALKLLEPVSRRVWAMTAATVTVAVASALFIGWPRPAAEPEAERPVVEPPVVSAPVDAGAVLVAVGEPVDAGVVEPPDAGAAIASTELDLVAPPRIKGSPGVKGSLGTKAMGALLGKPLAPPTKVIKSKKPMSKKEPHRGP